jgi:hypothetical protein
MKMNEKLVDGDDDEIKTAPILPKFISNVDYSHKKSVADLIWLPPNTQVNYRGQLVGPEHLDGNSYQFVTVAGDGLVMVWDIRFEEIALDELKVIKLFRNYVIILLLYLFFSSPYWSSTFYSYFDNLLLKNADV